MIGKIIHFIGLFVLLLLVSGQKAFLKVLSKGLTNSCN